MLLGRQGLAFAAQQTQSTNHLGPGLVWVNDLVDVTAFGGCVRVRELVFVFVQQLSAQRLWILGFPKLLAVKQVHRALGAHYGDLSGRPRQVYVGSQVLGTHNDVRAAVSLSGDDRD